MNETVDQAFTDLTLARQETDAKLAKLQIDVAAVLRAFQSGTPGVLTDAQQAALNNLKSAEIATNQTIDNIDTSLPPEPATPAV